MPVKSLRIISLGLGVQSSALYFASSMGALDIPRADFAIMAHPGRERGKTYYYLEYLLNWAEANNGIPIIVSSEKKLFKDLLNPERKRFSSIPAFTKGKDKKTGMLRRQCTNEYKIEVVNNNIRNLYQLKKYQRRPMTEVWLGISMDEFTRCSIPRESWKVNVYPFIRRFSTSKNMFDKLEWGTALTRNDLIRWMREKGLHIPVKSSCVFCPYQSDFAWAEMKKNAPDDFRAAVEVDKAIRNSTQRGIKQEVFLHNSLKPLEEVQFDLQQTIDWGECSGNCHL